MIRGNPITTRTAWSIAVQAPLCRRVTIGCARQRVLSRVVEAQYQRDWPGAVSAPPRAKTTVPHRLSRAFHAAVTRPQCVPDTQHAAHRAVPDRRVDGMLLTLDPTAGQRPTTTTVLIPVGEQNVVIPNYHPVRCDSNVHPVTLTAQHGWRLSAPHR